MNEIRKSVLRCSFVGVNQSAVLVAEIEMSVRSMLLVSSCSNPEFGRGL